MGNIKVETKHDLRYLEIIINILHKKEKKKRLTNTSTSHNKGFHLFFVKIFCLSVKWTKVTFRITTVVLSIGNHGL